VIEDADAQVKLPRLTITGVPVLDAKKFQES